MTRASRRQRKSTEVRQQEIVAAVLALADEIGPERITAETIARRVGLSQGAIFRHFPSMKDVWQAVFDNVAASFSQFAQGLDDSVVRDARTVLRDLVCAHIVFVETNPGLPQILICRELHYRNPEMRQRFLEAQGEIRSRFSAVLRRGQAEGAVRQGLDLETASALIVSTMQMTAILWSLSGRSFDLRQAALERVDIIWQGLAGSAVEVGKSSN